MPGVFDNLSDSRHFEQLLRDGIAAAKAEQRALARSLLNQAILLNSADARPFIWLSATTDDPQEKRAYLEQAVAVDPTNVAALRGLAVLGGKVDVTRLMPEGAGMTPPPLAPEQEAQSQVFQCPQCGGQMMYSVEHRRPVCQYCGYVQEKPNQTPTASPEEQAFDLVMLTTRGQRWAQAQHRLSCERCGAVSLAPAGEKSVQCPYCGSNQMITSPETAELIDPQWIIPMKIDAAEAKRRAIAWLSQGLFAPDDLRHGAQRLKLRPGYYSCWSFDGLLELRWNCEVKVGSGRYAHWETRSGVETRSFDEVLVSGVRALKNQELYSLEPFNLKAAQEFQPELLAGFSCLMYDRSLADASLLAREKIIRRLRPQLYHLVESGLAKRNLTTSGGTWSSVTFKHILLPIWIGSYPYQGKEYPVLVNGQTGKVTGNKPRDQVKVALAVATLALLLLLLGLALAWLLGSPAA